MQQVPEPVRVLPDEPGRVELGPPVFPWHRQERPGVVEPPAHPDEVGDVPEVRLLRVVPPAGLVVLLRRQQLGPDPLRAVAPGAVVPGVVAQPAGVPLAEGGEQKTLTQE